jgi:hypothetical protein
MCSGVDHLLDQGTVEEPLGPDPEAPIQHLVFERELHADLDHPTGADGGVLDLTWIPAARDAIAAVLAGAGWQLDPSRRRIKLRAGELPMWLPVTAPDTAPAVDAPRPWSVTPAITIDPEFEEQWTATEA